MHFLLTWTHSDLSDLCSCATGLSSNVEDLQEKFSAINPLESTEMFQDKHSTNYVNLGNGLKSYPGAPMATPGVPSNTMAIKYV